MTDSIQALVLCGGKGERLQPLTTSIPKPLVCIKDQPIIEYLIDHLTGYEINDFIFATGYQSEKFEEYLSKRNNNFKYHLSDAGDVDIIYRIKEARRYIQGDVIICYGDTLANVNIQELTEYHKKKPGRATITVWPLKSQFGIMEFDNDGMITSFLEKPVLDKWINIGYIYLDQELLHRVDDFTLFEDFIKYLIDKRELNGFRHRGVHITVNTLKELDEANKNIHLFNQK